MMTSEYGTSHPSQIFDLDGGQQALSASDLVTWPGTGNREELEPVMTLVRVPDPTLLATAQIGVPTP